MPSASSPSGGRAGAGRRWCTRADLLTVVLAATLCSATYCFSVWHNGRGAVDKIVLGPAPFVVAGATMCSRDDAASAVDAAAELDFEARHTAEKAGLSVSSTTAISGRRALNAAAAAPVDAGRRGRSPWPASSARGAEGAGGDKRWPHVDDDDDKITFTHAGAARA